MTNITSDLLSLFDTLKHPGETGSLRGISDSQAKLTAQSVSGYERYRVGKDVQGDPCLLIKMDTTEGSPYSPIALEHLKVYHNAPCRISYPDGSTEAAIFTLVTCTRGDRLLHGYFLRVCGALISALGSTPSGTQVSQAIEKLVLLFTAMTGPPLRSIQGIWAELCVITQANNPLILLAAWHATPDDRFDFNAGDQRIEVKSTSTRVRQHSFTLDQLHPPEGSKTLIASVFVQRSGGGASVLDLLDSLRPRLADQPGLILRAEHVTGLTLGNNWNVASEERFDLETALQSLAFYEADIVPSIAPRLPPGVSNVRFDADLSESTPVAPSSLAASKGLFGAALRTKQTQSRRRG